MNTSSLLRPSPEGYRVDFEPTLAGSAVDVISHYTQALTTIEQITLDFHSLLSANDFREISAQSLLNFVMLSQKMLQALNKVLSKKKYYREDLSKRALKTEIGLEMLWDNFSKRISRWITSRQPAS